MGSSEIGPHKVDYFGEIYCIHDSDCATSGTVHAYLWEHSPGSPWSSDLSGYYQFYSGGGQCPEAACGYGDWSRGFGTVQATMGLARYSYDVSEYMEGSECRIPYPDAEEKIWICAGEGGFGAFLW